MAPPDARLTHALWRFCRVWLVGTVVLGLAIGLFDAIIDPYLVIGTPRIAGLNAVKPESETHTQLAKDYLIGRIRPAGLLIGDSKVDIGLDPQSPNWPPDARPAFNSGIPGIDMAGMRARLRAGIASGPVRRVLVMVELQDLMKPAAPDAADPPPLPAALRQLQDMLLATLSTDALRASLVTILSQHRGDVVDLSPLGATSEGGFRAVVAADGEHTLFLQKDTELARRLSALAAQTGSDLPIDPARLQIVADMIAICREHEIALDLVISPFHADFLDLIDRAGLWRRYEAAKIALTQLVANAGGELRLWDFGSYDAYSTEPVPTASDRAGRTQWFWEPSHFKKTLGEKILAAIYRHATGYGIQLTPETIAAHLQADDQARDAYHDRDRAAEERLAGTISK